MSNQKKNKAAETDPTEAAGKDSAALHNEEDIPVQSLSEMIALAHEAEAELDKKESHASAESQKPTDKTEPVKAEAKPDAAKAAPKSDTQKPTGKNEPVKAETKPNAAKAAPKSDTQKTTGKNEPVKAEAKPNEAKAAPKSDTQKTTGKNEPVKAEAKPNAAKAAPKSDTQKPKSAAEDKLDRDLAIARKKKLSEEAYNKRLAEEARKKEAEQLQKAEEAAKRAAAAAENARILEERKAELKAAEKLKEEQKKSMAAASPKKSVRSAHKSRAQFVNRDERSLIAARAAAVFVVLVIIAYAGAFIYTTRANEDYYSELDSKLTGQSKTVNDSSREYTLSSLSALTYEEKTAAGLALGLADTDCDGLSDDYEINISKTDPLNPDTDGDGLSDGAEIINGLNPLSVSTDGSVPDSELTFPAQASSSTAYASAEDAPKTAVIALTDSDNNSIQGTPGIIGSACELYTDYNGTIMLTFTYTDDELAHWKTSESALAIYRFNSETLSFDPVESVLENGSVTAAVSQNGIYALADSGIITQESRTRVFFLIDNSGSMYPEELCEGSEENDVEFKRLDFAQNLIDKLGSNAYYGAGEFSGGYTRISALSNDAASVKSSIDAIRNKTQTFSGTEIAGAVISAAAEFDAGSENDKNYIVLLTDGMPSNYNSARDAQAIAAANEKDITIFTIGLGKYIDAEYLLNIANQTNGQFFQASNADALDNIYEKIQSFMSYNRVTLEADSGEIGYLIADCGFNVEKDGLSYSNFRTDYALSGADFGIAGLNMAYYTGDLSLTADSYTLPDGTVIPGYDISGIEALRDSKPSLSMLKLGILDTYNSYLSMSDKWNYRKVKDGVLTYTSNTRSFINSHNMQIITTDYNGTFPDESDFLRFCRTITFQSVDPFDSYENVYIDSSLCQDEDKAVMDLFRYYCFLPDSTEHSLLCDFGYDGDDALAALVEELTTGRPAVISVNGSAMNAVRLIRSESDPNSYVLEAYDSNSPGRITKINLVRSAIYVPGGSSKYQYAAYRSGQLVTLQLYIY